LPQRKRVERRSSTGKHFSRSAAPGDPEEKIHELKDLFTEAPPTKKGLRESPPRGVLGGTGRVRE